MKSDELNIDPESLHRSIPTRERSGDTSTTGYTFYGFDCVFLEDATWNALCGIAVEPDYTVDDLCLNIGNEFPDADFTQAARYYVCANSPPQSPDRDQARRGIAGDRCCGRRNRVESEI
jgi:hypothetical protein